MVLRDTHIPHPLYVRMRPRAYVHYTRAMREVARSTTGLDQRFQVVSRYVRPLPRVLLPPDPSGSEQQSRAYYLFTPQGVGAQQMLPPGQGQGARKRQANALGSRIVSEGRRPRRWRGDDDAGRTASDAPCASDAGPRRYWEELKRSRTFRTTTARYSNTIASALS